MKKLVIVFCILLCASAAFAKTASMQIGFSTLGVNAGAAAHFGDRFKVGVNGSIVLLGDKNSNDNSFLGWLFGQGFFSVDLIENTANDLDMRFAFAYMQIDSNAPVEEEDVYSIMFAGVTFGVQYTHWFGDNRNHGIYVGVDIPLGGYVATNDDNDNGHPFVGPFGSLATMGVIASSFRFGYAFQF